MEYCQWQTTRKTQLINMNKLLVMIQGFISNDKFSDTNLTDMALLYLSPIGKGVPVIALAHRRHHHRRRHHKHHQKILLRRGYFEFVTYGAAAYAIAGYWTGELNNVDRWTEVMMKKITITIVSTITIYMTIYININNINISNTI